MRIVFDTDEIRRGVRRWVKRLREWIDPYRALPEIFKCSCGAVNAGGLMMCRSCGGGNPLLWEHDFLTYTPPPKKWRYAGYDETSKFRWWFPHHVEAREKEWVKTLREIERAKTRDRRRGIDIPRAPRGRLCIAQAKRGEAGLGESPSRLTPHGAKLVEEANENE